MVSYFQSFLFTRILDANVAAKLAEIDIMRMDLTKANSKLEAANREIFVLKQKSKDSKDDSKIQNLSKEYLSVFILIFSF